MQVSFFKKRLMFCVAGLDRGFAANAAAVKDTEAAIYSLVGAAGGAPALSYQAPEGLPLVHRASRWGILSVSVFGCERLMEGDLTECVQAPQLLTAV